MDEIKEIRQFFENNSIPLSSEWLKGCIDWFKSEKAGFAYTLKEIQTEIYQQWLLLDLRDVECPVLPPNLKNQQKIVLNKHVCLQLLYVMDISRSKYSQISKIRHKTVQIIKENDEESVQTGNRVLQLRLTDGVQEIFAFEYKPVPQLHLNLRPGCKLLLISPLTLRRGQILLDATNIRILGGEVEDLLISNSVENILATKLNLPLTTNVIKTDPCPLIKSEPTIPLTNVNNFDETLSDQQLNDIFKSEIHCIDANPKKEEPPTQMDIDINDIYDDEMQAMLEIESEVKNEVKTPQRPILSLTRIKSMIPNVTKGVFLARVRFKAIVRKLRLDDSFSMGICIEDDSGEVEVELHNDLIERFLGHTADTELKTKIANDPEAKLIFMKGIDSLKNEILKLDNVVEVLIENRSNITLMNIL